MEDCCGNGGIALLLFNLYTRRRGVASFVPSLFTFGQRILILIAHEAAWASETGSRFGQEKVFLPLVWIVLRIIQLVV
jgi:hypothetical protein